MEERNDRALSAVLDQMESAVGEGDVSVREIVDHLGQKSLAALILVPALIAVSPASAIPGLTTAVALIVAVVTLQMLAGRECAWLPDFLARRRIPSQRLCQAIGWLRRPVAFVERFLRPRLGLLVKRPGLYPMLFVILAITCVMPFLELIPTTGSIASAAIAFIAAALLTRDGLLALVALAVVAGLPIAAWRFMA